MEIGRNEAASMGLNFAAFLRFVRNEATSILCSSLVVVALITFIELVLRPGVRRSFFLRLLEFKTKSYAQAQALVPWLLRSMSMRVRSLLLRFCARSSWRGWWTWKRTFILIQTVIGVMTLVPCTLPLIQAILKDGISVNDVKAIGESETQPTSASAGVPSPCTEDSALLLPPSAKLFAGFAVFIGGALMNCKAFMEIPVL